MVVGRKIVILFILIILVIISFALFLIGLNSYSTINDDSNSITGDLINKIGEEKNSKGVVIFSMDDMQGGWLEDIAIKLTETHISENVDVVVGVVPIYLERLATPLKKWNTNNKDVVEIAHHSYDHLNKYVGKSYGEQRKLVEKGREKFLSIGIQPSTYIPPFSEVDETTLEVLKDIGYHSFLEISNLHVHIYDDDVMEFENGIFYCVDENSGPDCTLKSNNRMISEINQKINNDGVALIGYHIQDFSTKSDELDTKKYEQFKSLLRELRESRKYQFMTAEEYRHRND